MPSTDHNARFADRVALVTGTSDRGIGGAIAERLVSEGASVCMLADEEPAKLFKRLKKYGDKIFWKQCDIRDQAQVDDSVKQCIEMFGRLDCLINNAGVDATAPVEETTEEQWQLMMDVNLTGVWKMTKAALPFLEQSKGAIVNISSAAGLGGTSGLSAYGASKAGVDGLTRSLAIELAPKEIRVVAIAPALVVTPMTLKHLEKLTPETEKQIEACHPLGYGAPQDVAAAVAFLASDEARWISGVTLPMGWMSSFPLSFD